MKTCPVCGATYTSRITFCFEDGAQLVNAEGADVRTGASVPRVPSRVATPVSPARRGRSLLSRRGGGGLSFTPPRATASPQPKPLKPPERPGPAPLKPLEIPVDEDESPYAELPTPRLEQGPPPKRTPTPPPAPERPEPVPTPTPAPVAEDRVAPPPAPEAAEEPEEEAFDEPDFFARGYADDYGDANHERAYAQEDEEERAGLPPWVIPAAIAAIVLVIVGGVLIGGAAGLIGTKALRDKPAPATATTATTAPAPAAAPAPAEPAPATAPEPGAAREPGTAAEPEPGAEEGAAGTAAEPAPAPVEPTAPEPAPHVAAVSPAPARAPAPAAAQPAPAPAAAPAPAPAASASPWGSLEVQQGAVHIGTLPSGAHVFIDGSPKGSTPIDTKLAYGDYTVKLQLEGYDTIERQVHVDRDKVDVRNDLQPTPKTASFIVVLEGAVGAMLTVDGTKVGPLPATVKLTEGPHKFTVESPSGTYTVTREVKIGGNSKIIDLSG